MNDVAIKGPVAVRRFVLEKVCHESVGHEHNYDHLTIVVKGRLRVTYTYTKDGREVSGSAEYSAGEDVVIKAHVRHTLKALEDNTVYLCVFSHRDFDGVVSQSFVGNQSAYL